MQECVSLSKGVASCYERYGAGSDNTALMPDSGALEGRICRILDTGFREATIGNCDLIATGTENGVTSYEGKIKTSVVIFSDSGLRSH